MSVASFEMHGVTYAQGRTGQGPLRLHGPANAQQDGHDERHQTIGLPKHHKAPGFRIAQKTLLASKKAPRQPRIFHRRAVNVLPEFPGAARLCAPPSCVSRLLLPITSGISSTVRPWLFFDVGINRRLANRAFEIAIEIGGCGQDDLRALQGKGPKPIAIDARGEGIGRSKIEAEAGPGVRERRMIDSLDT